MSFIRFVAQDDSIQESPLVAEGNLFHLPKTRIPANTKDVEFHFDDFIAPVGADGYFVIPSIPDRNHPTGLCRFHPREDQETVCRRSDLPIFGIRNGENAVLAIVSGMALTYSIVFGVKDGDLPSARVGLYTKKQREAAKQASGSSGSGSKETTDSGSVSMSAATVKEAQTKLKAIGT